MAKAFADITTADQAKDLPHADWLALLLDRETSWRRDKRLTARLRAARLRQQASVEDVDYRAARGLDRALFQKLADHRGRVSAACPNNLEELEASKTISSIPSPANQKTRSIFARPYTILVSKTIWNNRSCRLAAASSQGRYERCIPR
jgi:hypothetical protein